MGPHICEDLVLICKIIRVSIALLKKGPEPTLPQKAQFIDIIGKVLLPALSMVAPNPAVAFEMWDLLKLFAYADRYTPPFNDFSNWFLKDSTCTR